MVTRKNGRDVSPAARSKSCTVLGPLVQLVVEGGSAVATTTVVGVVSRPASVSAVLALNLIDVPAGKLACQSKKLQTGCCPDGHDA